jgi:flagellar hook-associated protein 3 FlgL
MRITNLMMVNNAIQNMTDNQERVSKLQNKVSTQKQFQTASENPVGASASLSLNSNLRTLESYSDTAATTQTWMTANDVALGQLEDIGVQASNLILRGLNDSLSANERYTSLGTEMKSLIDRAIEIGNTNVNGQYIFSGYQINQKPFDLTDYVPADPINEQPQLDYQGNPFTPKVLNYRGDTGTMQRNLGPDQSVQMNVRGDQAIQKFIEDLIAASDALTQNNIHNPPAATTPPTPPAIAPPTLPTLQDALTKVKSSSDVVNQFRTANGARLRQVESASSFLETVKIETKSLLSQKEDTNLAEGIALLTNQQTTYQAVLEVSQRAISALSLFDYMR